MIGALVLRPEPGNAATAGALEALGIAVLRRPLFVVRSVAWTTPDPAGFDALLLTSANAVRHAGDGLSALAILPVLAVGPATAAAARAAGLQVAITGDRDAAALAAAAQAQGFARPLHLAGRDHVALPGIRTLPVYASARLPIAPDAMEGWEDQVALLHSARAARRLAALISNPLRARIAVAALSPAVADAAGPGWAEIASADRPTDAALVACAAALIDRSADGVE